MTRRRRLVADKRLRCYCCNKLLAEKAIKGTMIVCSRCKARNEAD